MVLRVGFRDSRSKLVLTVYTARANAAAGGEAAGRAFASREGGPRACKQLHEGRNEHNEARDSEPRQVVGLGFRFRV